MDTLLKLDKADGNRAKLSFPKVRWSRRGNLPAKILAFRPEDESFTVVGEEHGERDYVADIEKLLSDGRWRTAKEIAAKRTDDPPGIGASEKEIKKALEGKPDRFESRTGEAAQAVGRSFNATVWSSSASTQNAQNADGDLGGSLGGVSSVRCLRLALKGADDVTAHAPHDSESAFEADADSPSD